MNRKERQKGEKIFSSENDYVVIDLETTDFIPSNCKIIEVSALRVRDNAIVDVYSTLVNPGIHIPSKITEITHINDGMVKNAPTITDVFDDFIDFIGDDIVIGHNIDTFDYNVIYDLHYEIKGIPFDNAYIDTYNLSKRCLPELDNHRLVTLADYLDIEVNAIHRAEADCYTTHNLYQKLKPLIDFSGSKSILVKEKKGKSEKQYAQIDNLLNNPFFDKTCIIYGAFKNIDTDKVKGFVQAMGANYVDFFCYSADYLILGTDMHKKYINKSSDELIDNVVNQTSVRILSENDFIAYSEAVLSSTSNCSDVKFKFDVSGKTICLTGEFTSGDKDSVANALISKGAIIKSNVIKKLDYLIVGTQGSVDWIDGKGTKRIKAEEYNAKGAKIQIIDEKNFIEGCELVGTTYSD